MDGLEFVILTTVVLGSAATIGAVWLSGRRGRDLLPPLAVTWVIAVGVIVLLSALGSEALAVLSSVVGAVGAFAVWMWIRRNPMTDRGLLASSGFWLVLVLAWLLVAASSFLVPPVS